ncbi:MAG: hypothetical protein Q9208_007010 [Pyrenodesmia sp. 3 TL-2023]
MLVEHAADIDVKGGFYDPVADACALNAHRSILRYLMKEGKMRLGTSGRRYGQAKLKVQRAAEKTITDATTELKMEEQLGKVIHKNVAEDEAEDLQEQFMDTDSTPQHDASAVPLGESSSTSSSPDPTADLGSNATTFASESTAPDPLPIGKKTRRRIARKESNKSNVVEETKEADISTDESVSALSWLQVKCGYGDDLNGPGSLGIQSRVLKALTAKDAFRKRRETIATSYEGLTSPSNKRSQEAAVDVPTVFGNPSKRDAPYLNAIQKSSHHPIAWTQPPNSDGGNALAARNVSLRPRFDPFTSLLYGYRMTWDRFESITPSIYAAHTFVTLFSKLRELVQDHWSHQPSLSSFEVKYGHIRLLVTSTDRPIPWDFVTGMAQSFLAKIERGLLGFFQVDFTNYVNGVAMGVGVALVGIQVVMAGFPDAMGGDGYLNNIIG